MRDFNYLVEKRRYLNSIGRKDGRCGGVSCWQCMFFIENNGKGIPCKHYEMEYPEEATEKIREWAEETPGCGGPG